MKLELRNIDCAYPVQPAVKALSDISFTIDTGELVGILGKTGAGKTTLLQVCTGLLEPTAGDILIDGGELTGRESWNRFRSRIGLVFQFPEKQLFKESVFDDVAFGVSRFYRDTNQVKTIANRALAEVGLFPEEFSERSPHMLSSGEKRKAAVAGIIALQPDILFMDEPTIGLDLQGMMEIESIIVRFHAAGKTVCVVSHNVDFIARFAERIMVLDEGGIVYDGGKEELFRNGELMERYGIEKPVVVSAGEELARRYKIEINGVYRAEELIEKARRIAETQKPCD